MNILFTGTSAAWPLPRLGCNCPICSSADPKDKRLRSSVIINNSVQIDAGPDYYRQYQKFKNSFSQVKHLFISHIHPDHYQGILDVAKIYNQDVRVYMDIQNCKNLKSRVNDASYNTVLDKSRPFKHGKTQKFNNIKITPFLVDHSTNTDTYGFRVEDKKSFVYITDFRLIPENSLKFIKEADLAVFDGSTLCPARSGHMAMTESLKLAKKLKIKKIYFTHIGHEPRMGTNGQLTAKNFNIAWDGLELSI